MIEKRFKLSKYATPSSVSYFCDENGRMLNKEVVKVLNELNDENIILKSELSFSQNQNRELRKVLEDNRSMAEVVERNKELEKENEKLKKRLSLYEMNEDEVDKYLRTHPMPTITNEKTITPLDMRHRW